MERMLTIALAEKAFAEFIGAYHDRARWRNLGATCGQADKQAGNTAGMV